MDRCPACDAELASPLVCEACHELLDLGGETPSPFAVFGLAPGLDVDPKALAFDHGEILAAGIERARSKLEYTTLGTSFCGPEFTVAELRSVYEAAWGTTLDAANFHRKVLATNGFVEPTGRTESSGPGRPARTYTAGDADALHPAIVRPA